MEYVDGMELRERLNGTPMDELLAIKIMKQVCSAVAEAHDLGIIHRDLKPENILLTEFRGDENFVKILDFGIAKIKHPEGQQGPQLTKAGIVYGTPEYLSPEQAQAHDLDPRTDIYALGCMLFEMLTGRMPFQAQSSVEILKQKVFEDPPMAANHGDIAPTMNEIIATAMAQDRENRFDDALEMFEALDYREEEIRSERQISTRETWFPGRELTGVHQTVDPEEPPDASSGEQVERTLPKPGEGTREVAETRAEAPPELNRSTPSDERQSDPVPRTSKPGTQIMDPPPGASGTQNQSGQQRSVKHHLLLGGVIGVSIILAGLAAYFGYTMFM
jgi:serine/threonine-protein kinase